MTSLVTVGLRAALKEVERVGKNVRFAGVLALTRTAQEVRDAETAELPKSLDRPTPFTQKAFTIRPATKRAPEATVLAKPMQSQYLQWPVFGGIRNPSRVSILVPDQIRLNKYGNMPRGAIQRLLKRDDTFSGQPESGRTGRFHGPPGIYQRFGEKPYRKLRFLVAYEPHAEYKRRFPFFEVANRAALKNWAEKYDEALVQAFK